VTTWCCAPAGLDPGAEPEADPEAIAVCAGPGPEVANATSQRHSKEYSARKAALQHAAAQCMHVPG